MKRWLVALLFLALPLVGLAQDQEKTQLASFLPDNNGYLEAQIKRIDAMIKAAEREYAEKFWQFCKHYPDVNVDAATLGEVEHLLPERRVQELHKLGVGAVLVLKDKHGTLTHVRVPSAAGPAPLMWRSDMSRIAFLKAFLDRNGDVVPLKNGEPIWTVVRTGNWWIPVSHAKAQKPPVKQVKLPVPNAQQPAAGFERVADTSSGVGSNAVGASASSFKGESVATTGAQLLAMLKGMVNRGAVLEARCDSADDEALCTINFNGRSLQATYRAVLEARDIKERPILRT